MTVETSAEPAGPQRARDLRRGRVAVNTSESPSKRAFADLWRGLLLFRLWGLLGWADIRGQYRRSTLGPLWLTLSTAIFVLTLGVLYANLFGREPAQYIPHLCVGFIVWGMITAFIEGGTKAFIGASRIIRQISAPLSVHAYRLIWATLLTTAHHSIVFAGVAIFFRIMPTPQWWLVVPGLLLIMGTGLWVILFLGMVSARFRDVPQVLAAIMRVMFFLTPVLWMPEVSTRRAVFITYNPFYHYIELIRAPLLNKPIDPLHWYVAAGIMVAGFIFTFFVYRRFRGRIAYWL